MNMLHGYILIGLTFSITSTAYAVLSLDVKVTDPVGLIVGMLILSLLWPYLMADALFKALRRYQDTKSSQ